MKETKYFPWGSYRLQSGGRRKAIFPELSVGKGRGTHRTLENEHSTFLVDCPIFDGNSGGPICTVPSSVAVGNSQSQNQTWLIGVATRKLWLTEVLWVSYRQAEKPFSLNFVGWQGY